MIQGAPAPDHLLENYLTAPGYGDAVGQRVSGSDPRLTGPDLFSLPLVILSAEEGQLGCGIDLLQTDEVLG